MSSGKWRPFCLGLNVLMNLGDYNKNWPTFAVAGHLSCEKAPKFRLVNQYHGLTLATLKQTVFVFHETGEPKRGNIEIAKHTFFLVLHNMPSDTLVIIIPS